MADPLLGKAVEATSRTAFRLLPKAIRFLFRYRILARRVAADAASKSIFLNERQLRKALKSEDVNYALRDNSKTSIDAAVAILGTVSARSIGSSREIDPTSVWDLVRAAHLALGPESEAIADLADQSRVSAAAGEATRTNSILFHANLAQLSATHRESAEQLHRTMATVVSRLVAELVRADTPSNLLRSWSASPPDWLVGETRLYEWLMELCLDHQNLRSASEWGLRALRSGSEFTEYVTVRLEQANTYSEEQIAENRKRLQGHPLIDSLLATDEPNNRLGALKGWNPATPGQLDFASHLRSWYLRDASRFDEAIEVGTSAWRDHEHYAAGLMAVECMLRFQFGTEAPQKTRQIFAARELALRIRDRRRELRLPSGGAVVEAMRASALLDMSDDALQLATSGAEGVATPEEAARPGVHDQAALILAETGRLDEAFARLSGRSSKSIRLQVEALRAESVFDDEEAKRKWSEAIAETLDYSEKAALAARVAHSGFRVSFVDQIATHAPEIAEEITLIAQLAAGDQGAAEKALDLVDKNRRIAKETTSYYFRKKDWARAAVLAERTARAWGDPHDWLRASHALALTGDYQRAYELANRALSVGGDNWGGRFQALTRVIEYASDLRDWDSAIDFADILSSENPTDRWAKWASISATFFSGDEDKAFNLWRHKFERVPAQTAQHASLIMSFWSQHGDDVGAVEDFLDLVNKFSDSEQVRGLAVQVKLTSRSSELHAATRNLIERFMADFPDQTLVMVPLGSTIEEKISDPLVQDLMARHQAAAELEQAAAAGRLPTGSVTQVLGNHAFILAARHKPIRQLSFHVDGAEKVSNARGSQVVLDTTALYTLATLPEDVGQRLIRRVVPLIHGDQLKDLNRSRAEIAGSRLTRAGSESRDHASAIVATELKRMHELFRIADRDYGDYGLPQPLDELSDVDGSWLAALNLASVKSCAFWCDDLGLSQLANEAGLTTFSTFDVIESLSKEGEDADVVASFQALVLHGWGFGLPYKSSAYELAMELDGGRPLAAASSLLNAKGASVKHLVEVFWAGIRRTADEEDRKEWSFQLARVFELDSQSLPSNFKRAYLSAFGSSWISAAALYAIHAGFCAVSEEQARLALVNSVTALLDRAPAEEVDQALRAWFVNLTQGLPADHRQEIIGILLQG